MTRFALFGSTDVLYVAETDASAIVGYALGRPGLSDIPPYDSELVAVHVHRAYQQQGIGRRLIAVVAARLNQEGRTSLMLWTLMQKTVGRSIAGRKGLGRQ